MRQGDNLLPGQLCAIAVSAALLTLPLICGLLYPGATTVISMAPSDTPAHNPQPEQRSSRNTRSTVGDPFTGAPTFRSEEHTSELQSLMRISYAVFCLKKKKTHKIPRVY